MRRAMTHQFKSIPYKFIFVLWINEKYNLRFKIFKNLIKRKKKMKIKCKYLLYNDFTCNSTLIKYVLTIKNRHEINISNTDRISVYKTFSFFVMIICWFFFSFFIIVVTLNRRMNNAIHVVLVMYELHQLMAVNMLYLRPAIVRILKFAF